MGTAETTPQVTNKKKKRHSFTAASSQESTSPQRRHRRDWSISSTTSATSASGNPRSQEDDVQRKLDKAVAMESMFASIRPTSVFSLRGDPTDDPSTSFSPIAPQSQWEAPGMAVQYSGEVEKLGFKANTQRGSPALSQTSFSSVTSDKLYSSPLVHPLSPPDGNTRILGMMTPMQLSSKVHVQAASKDLDAMDVDPFYIPVSLPTIHPGISIQRSC